MGIFRQLLQNIRGIQVASNHSGPPLPLLKLVKKKDGHCATPQVSRVIAPLPRIYFWIRYCLSQWITGGILTYTLITCQLFLVRSQPSFGEKLHNIEKSLHKSGLTRSWIKLITIRK